MGLFSFFKRNKTEYDFEDDFENLYNKIKLSDKEIENDDEDATPIEEIDVGLIEDTINEEIAVNSKGYEKSYMESFCEEMAIASNRIDDAKKEHEIVNKYLNDIVIIENADNKTKKEIVGLVNRIESLKKDQSALKKDQKTISEKKYAHMASYEHKIKQVIKDIYDDEQYLQSVKTDIHHLQGEKIALKYEKKKAISSLHFIRKYAKIAMCVGILFVLVLCVLGYLNKKSMVIPSLSVILFGTLVATFVVLYNQSKERELKITELKMKKAVGLINSYKLKYVNVKSRLDFMYELHDVKSAYELSNVWNEYIIVKKEREAIHRASNEMISAMERIINILEELGLYDADVWSSQMEALVDERQMSQIRHTLNVRKQKLRESIEYNRNTVEKNSARLKEMINGNPEIAKQVISIIERYESQNIK